MQLSAHPDQTRPAATAADSHGWRQERDDLLRAIAAGSIIGLPLLYTMEMWYRGTTVAEWHLLALLAAMLVANFLFCLFIGFRQEYSIRSAIPEAVTSVGVALAYSLAVLALIGAVDTSTAWRNLLGMVLIESFPVSLGVSFANAQVRNKSRTGGNDQQQGQQQGQRQQGGDAGAGEDANSRHHLQLREDLVDLAATVTGAVVFSLNIAPTEEILLIAARTSYWQQLTLMAASLVICHLILFASGFEGHKAYVDSFFQNPYVETLIAYAVSLLVAFALLALIGMPEVFSHTSTAVACTVALGLPAVVGAAAGRIIT